MQVVSSPRGPDNAVETTSFLLNGDKVDDDETTFKSHVKIIHSDVEKLVNDSTIEDLEKALLKVQQGMEEEHPGIVFQAVIVIFKHNQPFGTVIESEEYETYRTHLLILHALRSKWSDKEVMACLWYSAARAFVSGVEIRVAAVFLIPYRRYSPRTGGRRRMP